MVKLFDIVKLLLHYLSIYGLLYTSGLGNCEYETNGWL